MGAPDHFSIRGGANPHTRNRFGVRKRVRRDLAIAQWHGFAKELVDRGVEIFVVPPDPLWPGLVYPANAGCLFPLDDELPIAEKRFVLANLLPTRQGERAIYRTVAERIGYSTVGVASRFEGEADFFPVGRDLYLLSWGRIERQRFVPRLGFPPWRRQYGFRTERGALDELSAFAGGREVLALELVDEAYYHGDTCLAAFGRDRSFLLAWLEALAPESQRTLRERLGERLLPLSRDDAAIYAANSYRSNADGAELLFLPLGVSEKLRGEVRDRGIEPVLVDVSEFWRKGGGSVKCMIGDLGPLDPPADAAIAEARVKLRYRPP